MDERKIPEDQLSVPQQLGNHMWNLAKYGRDEDGQIIVLDPEDEERRRDIADHMSWITSIPHEIPSPFHHFKVGVYIRFFNQTKYENYLDYHKAEMSDTIALCPLWELVDFYVDNGGVAPFMENAKEWNRLLDDCFSGKVDLIITQKISNVSRNPGEMSFVARILAAQPHPIGIYFVNEDLFTLASYYQDDLRDDDMLTAEQRQMIRNERNGGGGLLEDEP